MANHTTAPSGPRETVAEEIRRGYGSTRKMRLAGVTERPRVIQRLP